MNTINTGSILNGRYRVVKQLSDRSYRVWDSALEQPRLLNIFSTGKTSNRPFLLAQLHHANLPRVTDVLVIENSQSLIIDYVAGQSIRDRIIERGMPIDSQRAHFWIKQIGSALQYMHQEGISHGSVTVDNIEVTATSQSMLTHFAIDPSDPVDDIRGLATAYFTMLSGESITRENGLDPLPSSPNISPQLQDALSAGAKGEFPTVNDFLNAVAKANPTAGGSQAPTGPDAYESTTLLSDIEMPAPSAAPQFSYTPPATPKPTPAPASADPALTQQPEPNQTVYLKKQEAAANAQRTAAAIPAPPKKSSSSQGDSLIWILSIGGLLGLVVIGLGGYLLFSLIGGGSDEPAEVGIVEGEVEDPENTQSGGQSDDAPPPTAIPLDDSDDANSNQESNDPEPIPTAVPLDGASDFYLGDRNARNILTAPLPEGETWPVTFSSVDYDEDNDLLYYVARWDSLNVIKPDLTVETLDFEEILGGPAERVISINPSRIAVFTSRAARGVIIDVAVRHTHGNFNTPNREGYTDYIITSVAKGANETVYIFGKATSDLGDSVHFAANYDSDSGALISDIIITSSKGDLFTADQNGFIYSATNEGVQKFNPEGFLITEFGEGALKQADPNEYRYALPTAIEIAQDGTVVMATRNGAIVIISQEGVLLKTYGIPLETIDCNKEATIDVGSVCQPNAIALSDDGSKIFYTDIVDETSYISVFEFEG